jgi:hypothetical protein
MPDCVVSAERPILVAASGPAEAALARAAVEELGLVPVWIEDAVTAARALCRDPRRFAAVVAGEQVRGATGLTLCGVARDAGCRVPMLLLTTDECRWAAVRAARLQVTVLSQPLSAGRVARALRCMVPPRPGAGWGPGETAPGRAPAQRLTAVRRPTVSACVSPAITSR